MLLWSNRSGLPLAVAVLTFCCSGLVHAETRSVRRGEDLQAALDAARGGDVILLEAGAEFVGNFSLPVKTGSLPIVVRSAATVGLPAAGERIRPDDAPMLARIRSGNSAAALRTAPGAHHWELRYLELGPNLNGYGDVLQVGDGSTAQDTLDKVPHHIVLTQLYVHGDPLVGQKRCVALNAAHVTIRDSHISDCKGVGIDSQAIGGWNGPGPYVIENNYLEAAGENVLFGGADPAIPGLVADGITFRRNHVARPFAWRAPIIATPDGVTATAVTGGSLPAGSYAYRIVARRPVGLGTIGRSSVSVEVAATVPAAGGAVRLAWAPVAHASEYLVYGRTAGSQATYWTVKTTAFVDTGTSGASGAVPTTSGTVWSVKNLFELKNARNVLVEDNLLENHWRESQAGYAIVLTPRNSGGSCSWCVVEQVRFEHNVVRHVAGGINLLGYDSPEPTGQANNIFIRDNLFYDVAGGYGGAGWFLLIGDGPRDVVVDHNTISHTGSAVVFAYGGTSADPREITGFVLTNNAVRHGSYGINGAYFSYGAGILANYFPGAMVTGNFLAGASASRYPGGNLVSGAFELEFVDAAGGDFRLRPGSALRAAGTDGRDIGCEVGAVLARVAGVEAGSTGPPAISSPANFRVVSH